jgi:hypothetical protein
MGVATEALKAPVYKVGAQHQAAHELDFRESMRSSLFD